MSYRSFEELDVWKRACRLAVRVYEVLHAWRDFGLKDPLTRSAVSIASKGSERNARPDDIRFLPIAKGAAAELNVKPLLSLPPGRESLFLSLPPGRGKANTVRHIF